MTGIIDYKFIPYVGSGIFILFITAIALYLVTSKMKSKQIEYNFEKQVKFSTNPEEKFIEKEGFLTKKFNELPSILIKSGVFSITTPEGEIKRKITLIISAAFLIGTIVAKNPVGGIILAIIAYFGIYGFASFKVSKKKTIINDQIPSFVAVFKANIQANQHAQNAMVNAINNTASPLYDELSQAKSIMEAGDFKPGIASIRMNASNETLRQLASCIELASVSGSNIEDQIGIIENIIADKQEIERKKKLGVNQNMPLFLVAGTFVPAAFFGSYLFSEMHRAYWFTTLNSYLILFGVLALSVLSVWSTWKVIKKIDIG